MFDLLIRGGRIVDGTGAQGFHADIGISCGRIERIAPRLDVPAVKTIDASGLTVTPGFLDVHSHNDSIVEEFPALTASSEQGITTQIAGMCGESVFPLSEAHLEDGLRIVRSLKSGALPSPAENRFCFGGYLSHIDRPLGTNMGFLVGHGTLRAAVMGFADRKPSPEEAERMRCLLREALDAGAFGISFGLIYPPGEYADADEMADLCRIVADRGGVMTVHMRSENTHIVEALKEMLDVTRRSGVRTVISHHKVTGGPACWGKTKETIALMEKAIADGLDVWCDQYPYTASCTSLSTNIPGRLHAHGEKYLLDLLSSRKGRELLRPLILGEKAPHERFRYTMIGWSPSRPEYNGRMLNEIADAEGKDPYELQCDILLGDRLLTSGIFHTMCEDDLKRVMQWPRTMVGCDGIAFPGCEGTHPRAVGTFPRVLGKYVREEKYIAFEEAIRRMTSMPAQVYGLRGKGIVTEGFDADLVILDPDTIRDRADYANFSARCEGLRYVITGGRVSVRDAVSTGALGGKVLRSRGNK